MTSSRAFSNEGWERARSVLRDVVDEWRRAIPDRSLAELAAAVGLSHPKSLEEALRPKGRKLHRPTFADIAIAIESSRLMMAMLPDGWVVMTPAEAEAVRLRLARAEALVAALGPLLAAAGLDGPTP